MTEVTNAMLIANAKFDETHALEDAAALRGLRKPYTLVADNSRMNRSLREQRRWQQGCRVTSAENRRQALARERAEAKQFDRGQAMRSGASD